MSKLSSVQFFKSCEEKECMVTAKIKRNPSGGYFVSLLEETKGQEFPKLNYCIGIDVGLKNFAILSDGITYKSLKFFRLLKKKLVKAYRIFSGVM